MVVDANSLGLFNALASILNSGKRDSDYAIAYYLATHVSSLRDLSISDIMTEAFVTRSAVRRFCNRVGFLSFSELKERSTEAAYPSDLNHRDCSVSLQRYRADLYDSIVVMFLRMEETVDNELIDLLARRMHACERVVLTCANNTSGILGRFQQELFYAGKVVHLVDDLSRSRLGDLSSSDGGHAARCLGFRRVRPEHR